MRNIITTGALALAVACSGLVLATSTAADAGADSGTYLVPSEITPGTYRLVPQNSSRGYYAVCGDYACEPAGGMISNDFFAGSAIMVIPPDAVSVELERVAVTRLA